MGGRQQRGRKVRCFLICLIALGAGSPASSDTIAEVLERSQKVRLEAFDAAAPDSARAQIVRNSFNALVRALDLAEPVELRIIRGDTLAETLQGRVLVANESLADWPEADRMFVLAHELGHIALGHWSQMGLMFQKWVPGTVTQQETDSVAALLARDGSRLAYQQEYEADAFASQTMAAFGMPSQDALGVFMRLGSHKDTATHPGTHRRLAALRARERLVQPKQ
jgi:predicted Zn-dependent protease